MPVNVSSALDSDTAEKVVVNRYSGEYVDGLYVKSIHPRSKKILASVQQPTAKELQVLPQGQRKKDIMVFISKFNFRTSDDTKNQSEDIIIRKKTKYKVIATADWGSYGYYMALGSLIK